MNWLIYHVGSGHALFVCIAMFLLAAFAGVSSNRYFRKTAVFWFLLGCVAFAISSTPLPVWRWVLIGLASLIWIVGQFWEAQRTNGTLVFVACWLLVLAFETPYHLNPSLAQAETKTLTVIGDSVTAGTGANDQTEKWPVIFAKATGVAVDDRSQPGERCSTALKHLVDREIESDVVLLEIGGNDLMGSTSNEKFKQDLAALLQHVCQQGRQVIMFELPLPPFRNQYGLHQRNLAQQHNVKLIPKRRFVSVITKQGNTIDSIHLTQNGHDAMAEVVRRCLQDAFESTE